MNLISTDRIASNKMLNRELGRKKTNEKVTTKERKKKIIKDFLLIKTKNNE